jgi:hypothetical protein
VFARLFRIIKKDNKINILYENARELSKQKGRELEAISLFKEVLQIDPNIEGARYSIINLEERISNTNEPKSPISPNK